MEATEKVLKLFLRRDGKAPFLEWIRNLRDQRAEQRIDARLAKLRKGNPGDSTAVGNGVKELRIHYGPGYRIYYGLLGEAVILILVGGNKSTQNEDIKKAKDYWREYKRQKNDAEY